MGAEVGRDGEVRGFRAIPPALVLAFGLDIVQRGWSSFSKLENWNAEPLFLTWVGLRIAAVVLAAHGTQELAASLTGRSRRGAQVAMIGYLLASIETVAFAMYLGVRHHTPHWTIDAEWWVAFTLTRVVLIGLAVSAWHRAALLIVVLELLMYPPSPLFDHLLDGSTADVTILWEAVRSILHVVALLVLATIAARRSVSSTELSRAVTGLRRSALGLWIRVVAAVGSGMMILLALAQSDPKASGGIAVAFVASAVLGVVASALFARGLLEIARAEIPDLPRWPFAFAAAATLWCAGVTLHQIPALYSFLLNGDERQAATIRALPVAPVLALLSALAITAVAIATAARRRGDDQLRAYAARRGLGAVLLVSGSVAVIAAVAPDAAAIGGLISMWGFALLARLCTQAASSFEHGATLPAARIVHPAQ